MESPGLVILAVLAVGALFILLPVALTTFFENRAAKRLFCPETEAPATVSVDAGRAAGAAIFGLSRLAVENCSLWPERAGCAERCLAPQESQVSDGALSSDAPKL